VKVLIIATLYPKDKHHSNKETSWAIHELVKGLSDYGINVVKVLRPLSEIKWSILKHEAVNFSNQIDGIDIETKSFIALPKAGFYFRKKDKIYFDDLLKDVDLIVAHMNFSAILAHKLSTLFDKPYLYMLHNTDLLKVDSHQKVFSNAKSLYCRSWALKRQFIEKNIPIAGVIYSGIDKNLILPYREHVLKSCKIISVNLLRKGKNIDITIEVLSELKEYNWDYTIIGSGEELENLQTLVKKYTLEDRIKFLGFKDRDFCITQMQKSDIFVMPSSPETFGLAYLEAMASGCLVIGAKGWGVDGMIVDGKNGYLVPPRDKKSLKNKFIEIFTNNQAVIYKNSYQTIQQFTLEKAQKNYATMIQDGLLR
jgi:glycosyltransferase involved in cell wall biosynthesis